MRHNELQDNVTAHLMQEVRYDVIAEPRLEPLCCICICTALAKKIDTDMHAKVQARACSRKQRKHMPVPQEARLSHFFLARVVLV